MKNSLGIVAIFLVVLGVACDDEKSDNTLSEFPPSFDLSDQADQANQDIPEDLPTDPGQDDSSSPDLGKDQGEDKVDQGPQDLSGAPIFGAMNPAQLQEEQAFSFTVPVSDPDGDAIRVFALDLPPGATWDEPSLTLSFAPDFTQGGERYATRLVATDGSNQSETTLTLDVADNISPPVPRVVNTHSGNGFMRLEVAQTTDAFLDSPGHVGREFYAQVMVPTGSSAQSPLPVRLVLHGFNGSPWQEGWSGEFRIAPHDPENTYWWGFGDRLPSEPISGSAPPYTQRRVLHLLDWVLHTYPGADADRVYIEGGSMGGAGAAAIGLLHARHFAWVHADIGQTVARNHRPSRIDQLSTLWGSPEANLPAGTGRSVWDEQDLPRALRDSTESRNQFITMRHGKDDPIIHFGAVIQDSPITGLSFYEALQAERVGHLVVWDEGAHGPADPVLGEQWWEQGWNPIFDAQSSLRRDKAFVAFSNAAHDGNPGDGGGNGNQSWNDERGYSGDLNTPGDCGWNGDLAGAFNRLLRWDASAMVDELDRFEIALQARDGDGGQPPRAGYPTTGDKFPTALPVSADVTLRRLQRFQLKAGEQVRWTFGSQSGNATANEQGELTLEGLSLSSSWQTLKVVR